MVESDGAKAGMTWCMLATLAWGDGCDGPVWVGEGVVKYSTTAVWQVVW